MSNVAVFPVGTLRLVKFPSSISGLRRHCARRSKVRHGRNWLGCSRHVGRGGPSGRLGRCFHVRRSSGHVGRSGPSGRLSRCFHLRGSSASSRVLVRIVDAVLDAVALQVAVNAGPVRAAEGCAIGTAVDLF